MSDENADDGDDTAPAEPASDDRDDRGLGFRFEATVGLLSDLLGPLGELNVNRAPPPPADSVDWTTVEDRGEGAERGDAAPRRGRMRRVRRTENRKYLLDTRFDGDEYVVTADIPGTSEDDLTVAVSRTYNQLVIKTHGTELERIPLPWESVEATRVLFNNGVLEVRLRQADA